jgi:hypothetical protein
VAKETEKFLMDVDEVFDGGDKNGEDSSETSGYDFASSVGPRMHETASASTPKIEISSSSRRVAMYQVHPEPNRPLLFALHLCVLVDVEKPDVEML